MGYFTRRAGLFLCCATFVFSAALCPSGTLGGEENDNGARVPPERAVVLATQRGWEPSTWPGLETGVVSSTFSMDTAARPARFTVGEAGKKRVFIWYFTLPVDIQRYPILVLSYRARGTPADSGDYGLWIDDGTGPAKGGFTAIRMREFLPDGEVHEIRKDLREFKPKGALIGMALGVVCGQDGPAEFELIGMRFEAVPGAEHAALENDAPIQVQVVGEGGRPLKGARVAVDADRANFVRASATDENGLVTLTPLKNETGTHSLDVDAEGMMRAARQDVLKDAAAPLRVVMKRAVHYGGIVCNDDGEPVAGARITLWLRRGPVHEHWLPWTLDMVTDAKGCWQTRLLPDDLQALRVQLHHKNYITAPDYCVQPVNAEDVAKMREGTHRFVLNKGLTVTGKVSDKEGKPIVGAVIAQDQCWECKVVGHTDERGQFRLENVGRFWVDDVGEGSILLAAQKAGYAPQKKVVPPKKEPDPVEFVLQPGKTVRGKVLDTEGRPLAGVSVGAGRWGGHNCLTWEAKTGNEGRFAWDGAPSDTVEFNLWKEGYMIIGQYRMRPSQKEFVLMMPKVLKVSGTVVDAETKEPIKQFNLVEGFKMGQGRTMVWERQMAEKCTDGRYEITLHQLHNAYQVAVEAETYLPAVSRVFKATDGDQTFNFELKKGRGPSGVVRLPDGKPAGGAELLLAPHGAGRGFGCVNGRIPDDSSDAVFTKTGPDGHFEFPPQYDRYSGVAIHDQGYVEFTEEDLKKSQELTVKPWGRVKGQLLIGRKPAANEWVEMWFYPPEDPKVRDMAHGVFWRYEAKTDDKGGFLFERVCAMQGHASYHTEDPHEELLYAIYKYAPVKVEPGKTVEITVAGPQEPLKPGDDAPLFEEATLDGNEIKLADLRGKHVLLVFWTVPGGDVERLAPRGSAAKDIPHLKAVYDAFSKDERLVMLSLSMDLDATKVSEYTKKNDLKWTQALVGSWVNRRVSYDYGVRQIPAIFLIGPDGKIIARDLRGEAIKRAVQDALAAK